MKSTETTVTTNDTDHCGNKKNKHRNSKTVDQCRVLCVFSFISGKRLLEQLAH